MRLLIVALFIVTTALSQDTYRLPFASEGNVLELTIANTSPVTATRVTAEASETPPWLKLSQRIIAFDQLKPGEEKSATFTFAVDKLAPVDKEQTITFVVKSVTGESWTKEISIKIAPPDRFELYQNYPNPFNPSTTICYQLPNETRVNLKIYNVIGQEVATLVDAQRQPGYYQEVFDATRCASGMYIYRLTYTNEAGKQASDKKTMLVVK